MDFHCLQTTPDGGWTDYRQYDGVFTGEGIREEIQDALSWTSHSHPTTVWDTFFNIYDRPNDHTRQKYAARTWSNTW